MAATGRGRSPAKGALVGLGARASYLHRSASAPGPAVLTAILLLASQPAIVACSSGGLTSSASASAEGSQPGGDAGQVHYRSQGEADASLARFGRDHPQCQLWTNWQKMCSRTGPGGSTHCVGDPEMQARPSTPFCVRPAPQTLSPDEARSHDRFCEERSPSLSASVRGSCRFYRADRPFNGYHLSAVRTPICRRWVDAGTRTTVCREGVSGPDSCDTVALHPPAVPLACAETVTSPACNLHPAGVVQHHGDEVITSDLLLMPTLVPVNGLSCLKVEQNGK
jgi:hypothetical protein